MFVSGVSVMTHAFCKSLFFLSKLHLAGRIFETLVFEALLKGCRREAEEAQEGLAAECPAGVVLCTFIWLIHVLAAGGRPLLLSMPRPLFIMNLCPLVHPLLRLSQVGEEIWSPASVWDGPAASTQLSF